MAAMAVITNRFGDQTQMRLLMIRSVFSFPKYFVDRGVALAILVVVRLDQ
jgi:hypothetical protein